MSSLKIETVNKLKRQDSEEDDVVRDGNSPLGDQVFSFISKQHKIDSFVGASLQFQRKVFRESIVGVGNIRQHHPLAGNPTIQATLLEWIGTF